MSVGAKGRDVLFWYLAGAIGLSKGWSLFGVGSTVPGCAMVDGVAAMVHLVLTNAVVLSVGFRASSG